MSRQVVVAEVSADHVVLVRRWLWHRQEITLTEHDVRRIDVVDPTWQGALLGAVVGGSLGAAIFVRSRGESRLNDCNLCPLGQLIGVLTPIAGAGVGASIDGAITRPVYKRPPHMARIGLVPILARNAIGALAAIRF